jgi:hypothetical protein
MRYAIIAMLLCACASSVSGRRATVAVVEASYKEFEKELSIEHYDKAKTIVDQKRLDRVRVVSIFTATMWQKLILTKEITVSGAKSAFEKFKLDRATETAFAVKVFDFYVANNFCEMAGDVVVSFEIGSAFANKAVHCAQASAGFNYVPVARLVCRMPSAKELQIKLINGWVDDFKHKAPSLREYFSFWRGAGVYVDEYASMAKIVTMCPLTEDQYLDLFMIGLQDKKPEFTKVILEKNSFKKTVAHYKEFIAMAVEQHHCAMAAEVALKNELSDQVVEKIFLNRKCLGGTLKEIDPALFSPKKADWFFNLSLRAQEFALARRIIKTFSLDKDHFDKLVSASLAAYDYKSVLLFEPWDKERGEDYRDGILNKVLDANEEWAVTTFVVDYSTGDEKIKLVSETNRNAWLERTFLRAFRRREFSLAADVANKHLVADFRVWATKWVFEAAMQARNADQAKAIAVRNHLGKEALRRVAVLYFQLKNEKNKNLELEKKRAACEAAKARGDWEIKKCD